MHMCQAPKALVVRLVISNFSDTLVQKYGKDVVKSTMKVDVLLLEMSDSTAAFVCSKGIASKDQEGTLYSTIPVLQLRCMT